MEAVTILNLKNFNFWSRDCNRVQYLLQCSKFHQNGTIFKMAAVRHLGF